MSANFPAPIGRGGLSNDAPETSAWESTGHKRAEREQDAWALAITQVLVEARPRLTLPGAPELDDATGARASESVKISTLGAADAGAAQGSESTASSAEATPPGAALPTRVIAELSDSRLGRMELSVARGVNGLHIVINVADAHVKALIESEQAVLLKSLQGCGLRIDSVHIGSQLSTGTALAPEEGAEADRERALARSKGNLSLRSGGARWRGYIAPAEEEPEDDSERVDLTA